MLSDQQIQEKKERIKKVIEAFLSYDNITIAELSEVTNVSSSTIQRDLRNFDFIQMIYLEKSKEVLEIISEKLNKSKEYGLSRGGINSTTNNEPIRDENGRFIGNKKR